MRWPSEGRRLTLAPAIARLEQVKLDIPSCARTSRRVKRRQGGFVPLTGGALSAIPD